MGREIPIFLAISERRGLDRPFERWLEELLAAGVEAVQIREKELADRELFDLACRARRALGSRALLLINGRADIAVASGADGVHLPARGLPIKALRDRIGTRLMIGVSTHHPDEVSAARRAGADYATFGPIFPTPSKMRYGPPPGLEGLRQATRHGLPVLALGGLAVEHLETVRKQGAAGIAGIRLFQDRRQLARLCTMASTS